MIYATSLLARSSTAITHVQRAQQRVLEAQYDIASGASVRVGSDDPVAAASALRMRGQIARLKTWSANIDLAEGRQNTMDSALQEMNELLTSAKAIAVQGASSATMTEDSLRALASETQALIARLQSIANTESGGCYLFGGTATAEPPFVFDGDNVTYRGTTTAQEIAISSTMSTDMTMPGQAVFLSPVDVFSVLADLRDALSAGDTEAISAGITRVQEASSSLYTAQTRVGSATQTLTVVRSILDGLLASTTADLSTAADTDMAEASVRLSAASIAYEAALEIASRITSPTLLDFL